MSFPKVKLPARCEVDLVDYGRCYVRVLANGKAERIDPYEVRDPSFEQSFPPPDKTG